MTNSMEFRLFTNSLIVIKLSFHWRRVNFVITPCHIPLAFLRYSSRFQHRPPPDPGLDLTSWVDVSAGVIRGSSAGRRRFSFPEIISQAGQSRQYRSQLDQKIDADKDRGQPIT